MKVVKRTVQLNVVHLYHYFVDNYKYSLDKIMITYYLNLYYII